MERTPANPLPRRRPKPSVSPKSTPREKITRPRRPPGTITVDEFSELFSGLKDRARQLLAQEGNYGAVKTTELALSGLRRQKRESQPWSVLNWANEGHFFAAGYQQMVRALRDKARSRRRRPDREHAGNLGSEFLAPLVEAGALRLSDLAQDPETPGDVLDVIAKAMESLKSKSPELAETLLLARIAGRTQEEIARLTGVTDRQVRNRINLAQAMLAEQLLGEFPQLKKHLRSQ